MGFVKVVPFAMPPDAESWEHFGLQRKILRIAGVWPGDSSGRAWHTRLRLVFNLSVVAFCSLAEFMHCVGALQAGSLEIAVESICPTLSRISACLRLLFVKLNENKFDHVLRDLRDTMNNTTKEEQKVIDRLRVVGHKLTFYLILPMCIIGTLYAVTPLAIMGRHLWEGKRPVMKLLPFKMALPFDSQNTLTYVMLSIVVNYATIPTITGLAGSDALFYCMCLYISNQFEIVQRDLLSLREEGDTHDVVQEKSINRRLKEITRRHHEVDTLMKDMVNAFTPNTFLVFTSSALIICVACIALLTVPGPTKCIFAAFIITDLAILFLYSFGGTMLCSSSEAVQMAAYSIPWYQYSTNSRQLIQMLILRSQNTSKMRVPFFEVSVATFSAILRTAGSYITLMKSFL